MSEWESVGAIGGAGPADGGFPTHGPAARRARRILRATAVGGGGVGALGVLTAGLLYGQAALAHRSIPLAETPPPRSDGRYGAKAVGAQTDSYRIDVATKDEADVVGVHIPAVTDIHLAILGDSLGTGFGVEFARDTPGALLAAGIAEQLGRPVVVRCHAFVGATSAGLGPQVERAVKERPDLAIILVGANDVTHRVRVPVAIQHLTAAVTALRDVGAEVVVCTCPDLGTIRPIQPPLRWLARRWSRDLAAAQTVAAVSAGARTVSLGDLLGPQFTSAPDRMFGADRFHPSVAGYAVAAASILPTAIAALALPSLGDHAAEPKQAVSAGNIRSLVEAAAVAANRPGTEVTPANVAGVGRPAAAETSRAAAGAGRWAELRHRVGLRTQRPQDPTSDSTSPSTTDTTE